MHRLLSHLHQWVYTIRKHHANVQYINLLVRKITIAYIVNVGLDSKRHFILETLNKDHLNRDKLSLKLLYIQTGQSITIFMAMARYI